MEAKDFCYWLNGYLEMSETKELSEKQLQILKDHLALVFNKVTPTYVPGLIGQSAPLTYYDPKLQVIC